VIPSDAEALRPPTGSTLVWLGPVVSLAGSLNHRLAAKTPFGVKRQRTPFFGNRSEPYEYFTLFPGSIS
jgi:hypothetical protein